MLKAKKLLRTIMTALRCSEIWDPAVARAKVPSKTVALEDRAVTYIDIDKKLKANEGGV